MERKIMPIGEQIRFLASLPEGMNPHRKLQRLHKEMAKPRLFFQSVVRIEQETKDGSKAPPLFRKYTYRRPRTGNEIKGKSNIKAAKKAKVRAMKAEAQAK